MYHKNNEKYAGKILLILQSRKPKLDQIESSDDVMLMFCEGLVHQFDML
jgi:hypothetical protein